MDTTEIAIIEAFRTYAERRCDYQLAHLCTAALGGEVWAQARLIGRIEHTLNCIDTDRPDGAIARSFQP